MKVAGWYSGPSREKGFIMITTKRGDRLKVKGENPHKEEIFVGDRSKIFTYNLRVNSEGGPRVLESFVKGERFAIKHRNLINVKDPNRHKYTPGLDRYRAA